MGLDSREKVRATIQKGLKKYFSFDGDPFKHGGKTVFETIHAGGSPEMICPERFSHLAAIQPSPAPSHPRGSIIFEQE